MVGRTDMTIWVRWQPMKWALDFLVTAGLGGRSGSSFCSASGAAAVLFELWADAAGKHHTVNIITKV